MIEKNKLYQSMVIELIRLRLKDICIICRKNKIAIFNNLICEKCEMRVKE